MTDTFFLLVMLIGFLAQYIYRSASMLLALSFQPAVISASVHMRKIIAGIPATLSHWKFRNIRKEISIPPIIFGTVGGVLGTYLLMATPDSMMKPFVAVLLLILGIRILIRFFGYKDEHGDACKEAFLVGALIAAPIGSTYGKQEQFKTSRNRYRYILHSYKPKDSSRTHARHRDQDFIFCEGCNSSWISFFHSLSYLYYKNKLID
ncbi:MAG: sulfite exporter TauE/SafE family protein [Euryarchaeota archaeon]|nr:sulfite exporter TauE/SafE family protein [Euryarchaeota archaeon]